jgi:hypothetical protein
MAVETGIDVGLLKTEIKEFFGDPRRGAAGLYFMFSRNHIVLVKDGVTHEFTAGGYKTMSAMTYDSYNKQVIAPGGVWTIRKLPATYRP